MQVWFTADLHLGHANILRYCNRPFLSAEEQELVRTQGPRGPWRVSQDSLRRHDDALIDAINEAVAKDDQLWILGDFCLGPPERVAAYRQRIRCRTVNLVWGNHDRRTVRRVFQNVIDQGMIKVKDQSIWLNHYPMRSWHRSFHGSWHLYGHVHGRLARQDEGELDWMLTRDVGVDACEYRPVSFEELAAYMAPRLVKFLARKQSFLVEQDDDDPVDRDQSHGGPNQ
jgi:calcineurin-like phosphoesterase family protein